MPSIHPSIHPSYTCSTIGPLTQEEVRSYLQFNPHLLGQSLEFHVFQSYWQAGVLRTQCRQNWCRRLFLPWSQLLFASWFAPYIGFGVDTPHHPVNIHVTCAYKNNLLWRAFQNTPREVFSLPFLAWIVMCLLGFFGFGFLHVCGVFPFVSRSAQGFYNLLKCKTCLFCATAYAGFTTKMSEGRCCLFCLKKLGNS